MPFRIRITVAILLALLILLLVGPLFVPIQPLEDTVPPHELAYPDSKFASLSGLSVHYQERGAGQPAFVLLHGFGSSTFTWREVLEPLGDLGYAVAFDRPAFGLTSRPLRGEWQGENPYTPEAQVELTVKLMDKLGIKEAILIGNSSGGTVAIQVALEHPERVKALILVDAAVYDLGGPPAWIKPLLGSPQMDRLGPLIMRQLGGEAGTTVLKSGWFDKEKLTEEILAGYRRPLRAENWDKALWEVTKASRPPKLAPRLDNLDVPTLVISGAEDTIVPLQLSERLASDIPGAELVVLEQCGHLPQEECPEAFMDAVSDFVKELG